LTLDRATPPRGSAGFTLIEALVALVLVGVAILLDLGLQMQSREIDARLAAEAELLRRAEAVLESVRAGVHPLTSGPVDGTLAWPDPADPALAMILLVERTDVAGLCHLVVRGQSREPRGRPHDVELETLLWRPGSLCR
jgi:prepilin-type N-terminal cleavage/methylation domain-containing protein